MTPTIAFAPTAARLPAATSTPSAASIPSAVRASTHVRPPPPCRKFNPGLFQSDQEVIAQFVVRRRELAAIIGPLQAGAGADAPAHALVVARPGLGKSMLMARAAAEMRVDSNLRSTVLPVRFMEDNPEVFDAADLWLEALYHIARECAPLDDDLAWEIDRKRAALLRRRRGDDLADGALNALLDAADRLDRKLVLMVENLQEIVVGAQSDFGWRVRRALRANPQIILLCTATRQLDAVEQPGAAFFDFFRIIALEPLDADQCRTLWRSVSGEEVDERRMRPLALLTGGSPRLLATAAASSRHRPRRHLMEEVAALLDDHAEEFRRTMNALPRTERRVYAALADLWQPECTTAVSERARLDARTTSALIRRLVNRGMVKVWSRRMGQIYAVVEPLHCIHYKLRRQTGRAGAREIRGVVDCMAAFYGLDEGGEVGKVGEVIDASMDLVAVCGNALDVLYAIGRGTGSVELPLPLQAALFSMGGIPFRVAEQVRAVARDIIEEITARRRLYERDESAIPPTRLRDLAAATRPPYYPFP